LQSVYIHILLSKATEQHELPLNRPAFCMVFCLQLLRLSSDYIHLCEIHPKEQHSRLTHPNDCFLFPDSLLENVNYCMVQILQS